MNIKFEIKVFDPKAQRIGIFIPEPTDELVNFLRSIPKRVYNFSERMNYIPLDQLQNFFSKADEKEYLYTMPADIEKQIDQFLQRADYITLIDARHGRIVLKKNRPNARSLYQSGLTTWRRDYDNYSISISEAYQLPVILPIYNAEVTIEYSPEVKEIFEKEASRRAELISLSTATDAPDISSDILFELRPFQKVAKKFALNLNGRAILAYDMGLGKTPIAISIVEALPVTKALIVCPATLKTNWSREIKKAVNQDCNILSGTKPSELAFNSIVNPRHKYHIINYDILGRGDRDKEAKLFISMWAEAINLAQFDIIIFDEAHYTKNVDSGRSKASRRLKSKFSLALTGTPIVNRPSELWPLLNIIDPQNFPSYESFCGQWLYSDGKSIRNEKSFREMLAAYMIRRRKDDVIKDLPMIERIDHFIELSDPAKARYKLALEGIYQSLRNPEYEKDITNALVELQRLKQIVADDTVAHTVEKAEEIYEESEKKILIFSQFVSTCHDIHSRLEQNSLCITGEDSDSSRYEKIDKFQSDPSIKYMVLSTKAGAEGLTLTAAHYVIFNDLCWTPKDHRQAEARCYGRMNDLHGAVAYYMQAENTVTEIIMAILRSKLDIIERTIDGINKTANEGASIINDLLRKLREEM